MRPREWAIFGLAACVGLATPSCGPFGSIQEDWNEEESAGDVEPQELKSGTTTTAKPGIGTLSWGCGATLITPRHLVTA